MGKWGILARRVCVALVTLLMLGTGWAPSGRMSHHAADRAPRSALATAGVAEESAKPGTSTKHGKATNHGKATKQGKATKRGTSTEPLKPSGRKSLTKTTAPYPKPAERAPQPSSAAPSPQTPTADRSPQAAPPNSASRPAAAAPIRMGDDLGIAIPAAPFMWKPASERDRDLDRLASTGVRWMRLDVYMDQLTWVNPGQIEWAPLDATVNAARERNLEIIGLLGTLPSYGRPNGSPNTYGPTSPEQRAMFAEFAAKAAQRYQGRINTWEVWNEPNVDQFWYPTPNVADYAKLLTLTYSSIKGASPEATVLSGGTGGRGSAADIEPTRWVDSMYQTGLRDSFDGLAIHAYAAPESGNLGEVELLPAYRAIMDRHADAHKRLWITEAGTQVGRSARGTEAVAASNVPAIIKRWKDTHDHGPLLFYTLNDSTQAGFGLYRTDGSARPSVGALAQAAAAKK